MKTIMTLQDLQFVVLMLPTIGIVVLATISFLYAGIY
jgi:hypothetical protein